MAIERSGGEIRKEVVLWPDIELFVIMSYTTMA
nr:MAG TPA: hypothetical protein [Bacteriophage sp.]